MDMSQGEIFTNNDVGLSGNSSDASRTGHLQNLEDFEARALQDDSASLQVNSIPAENMLWRQGSARAHEFACSPTSPVGSKSRGHFSPEKPQLLGSLNDDSQSLLKPDGVENSFRNVKGSMYDRNFVADCGSKDAFDFDARDSSADAKEALIRHREVENLLKQRLSASRDRKMSSKRKPLDL